MYSQWRTNLNEFHGHFKRDRRHRLPPVTKAMLVRSRGEHPPLSAERRRHQLQRLFLWMLIGVVSCEVHRTCN